MTSRQPQQSQQTQQREQERQTQEQQAQTGAFTAPSQASATELARTSSAHAESVRVEPTRTAPNFAAPAVATSHVPLRTKLAIVSVGLLSFVGILTETSMNVTFPTLMVQMGVSLATVQWLTTGYLLLVTIVMSTTAYVLKRFGARSLFIFAFAMSVIGTVMCLVAPSFLVLLAGRMFQACATGIATPLMYQLIFTRVPLQRIGLYTGFASVIISLAPALGPTYGGVLTSMWSWRTIFSGVLPLLALIAIAGLVSVPDSAARQRPSGLAFDAVGVALLAVTFTSVLVTFDAAGVGGWTAPGFWIGVVACAVLIGLVAWHAKRGTRRIFDYSILGIRAVRLRLFSYVGLQFINIGMSFILPLYAQNVLGASAMQAGLMLLPGALLGAVASPVAGRFYDRHGARGPLGLSVALACAALALMLAFTHSFTLVLMGVLYALLRVGFNTGFGVTMSDASTHVAGPAKSDLNSLFSMMQQFAGSFGTAVVSAVISAQTLVQPAAAGTVDGSRVDFAILLALAVCMAAAVVASFRLARRD